MRMVKKLTAALLVLTLTMANVLLLAQETYAVYEELESQRVGTNNPNVGFDSYFKVEEKNKHFIEANKTDKILLYVKVNTNQYGYLKEASIDFENQNYTLDTNVEGQEGLNAVDVANSKIKLNRIKNGEEVELAVPVSFQKTDVFALDYFNRESKVKLTGKYINAEGKEVTVTGEVKVRVAWKADAKVTISQEVEKYLGISNDVILQTSLNTQVMDNMLPMEKQSINVTVPEMNGQKPSQIKVIPVTSMQEDFSTENWTYDKEKGMLTIQAENKKTEENTVRWAQGTESYKIVYRYEGQNKAEKTAIHLKAEASTKVFNRVEDITAIEEKVQDIEEKGSIVSGSIETTTESNKGYLYANSVYETPYTTRDEIQISEVDFAKEIEVMHNSSFVKEDEKKVDAVGSSYYKASSVSKANIEKILGEKGTIEIYDQNANLIAKIDRNSEANEEGNIVISYEQDKVSAITIKIHQAEKEGILEINHNKAIKAKTGYSIEEMKKWVALEEVQIVRSLEKELSVESRMKLNETVTKVEASISNTNLSTVVKNENVELKVTLDSDASKYDLYKNPVIEIKLPSEITNVEVKSANLFFSNEIKIKEVTTREDNDGNKIIRIVTTGEQTEFIPEMNKGIQIILNTNLELKKNIPSSEKEIIVNYTNEKANAYADDGVVKMPIRISSPTGMITLNSMKNFDVGSSVITSIGSKEQVGKLEILTGKKTATNEISVINNNEYTVYNPYILGRLPFVGNKKVSGEDLGTNIDAYLKSEIVAKDIAKEAYTVYYSENGTATSQIEDSNNGWTVAPADLAKVKSYLIVLNNKEMQQGVMYTFSFDIEIPENLNYNKAAYSDYAIYYENRDLRSESVNEVTKAPIVGVTTGQGPELEAKLTGSVANGGNVEEGTRLEYTVKIENKGATPAKNVKVKATIPEGATYVEYVNFQGEGWGWKEYSEKREVTIEKDEIAGNSTVEVKYYMIADGLEFEENEDDDGNITIDPNITKEIKTRAIITADNVEKDIETVEYTNIVVPGSYTFEMETNVSADDGGYLQEEERMEYTATIQNVNIIPKHDLIVTYVLPEGLKYIESKIIVKEDEEGIMPVTNGIYDQNTRTLTCKISKLAAEQEFHINVTVEISKLVNLYNRTMESYMTLTSKEKPKEIKTNSIIVKVSKPKLTVTHTSNRPDGRLTDRDTIEYYITIANEGGTPAEITLTDDIPDGLYFEKIIRKMDDKITESGMGGDIEAVFNTTIPAGKTVLLTMVARAKPLQDAETKEIENKVKIESTNAEVPTVPSLRHTIERSESIVDPGGNVTKVYRISGLAWLDPNKDGRREETDQRIGGVEVILVNAITGEIVRDPKTGDIQRGKTNQNGDYVFMNVTNGSYFIAYLYDTSKYGVTNYQQEGINEAQNSDAIATKLNIDGEYRLGAITNTITVVDSNVYNVDIGLVEAQNFDLRLDKVVNKIIVQNAKGTKEYKFEDSKLAKVEIDAKYANSTTVIIEYKIKITNEGKVDGYVKNIVDYLPKELQFKSELNPNWYIGKDEQAYSTSLQNELIKAGETKEITLTCTKKMSETDSGVISNMAEIAESYNEYGLPDIDSIEGNRDEAEDDFSSADVIIGIKTGKVATYITLTITLIIIIGVGAYMINKKIVKA